MIGQRVLLTGTTGFLGQHLLRRLLRQGAHVFALGRTAPSLPVEFGHLPLTFLPCDFADGASFAPHREVLARMNSVVHLGGFVLRSSNPLDDDAVLALRTNAEGTAHLLAHLPPTLTAFCHASTMDVYGPPSVLPVREEHPTQPATCYAASKLAAEKLVQIHGHRSRACVTILRLSQVYGPGDTSRKAIPNFIRTALRGETPVVTGDGAAERDYVYVDDVLSSIELALTRGTPGLFNIAGGCATSIRQVAAAISRLAGGSPSSEAPARSATCLVDLSRAAEQLHYHPQVRLEDGLLHTLAWFRRTGAAA